MKATTTGYVIKGPINSVEVISVTDDTYTEYRPATSFNHGVGDGKGGFGIASHEVVGFEG